MAESVQQSATQEKYEELLDEDEDEDVDLSDEAEKSDPLANASLDRDVFIRKHQAEIELHPKSEPRQSEDKPSIRKELKNIFNAMTRSQNVLNAELEAPDDVRGNFAQYKILMDDITPDHDGGIFKRILQQGTGASAQLGKIVTFHYSLSIEDLDEPFDSSISRGKLQKTRLGKDMLIAGLQIALLSMKEGELADFVIDCEYAFGKLGIPPHVPPSCTIRATVRLVECTEEDPVDAMAHEERRNLPPKETIAYVKRMMEEGKKEFGRGKVIAAINRYKSARLQAKIVNERWSVDEKQELKELLTRLHKNLATCYSKVGLPKKVKCHLEKLDQMGVADAKTHFLWAKVHHNDGDYHKALLKLEEARAFEPQNPEIAKMFQQVHRDKKEYESKSKEQMKRMFADTVLAAGDSAKE